MEVTFGKDGLTKTWQAEFPEETKCCRCGGNSRIGFVAHEGMEGEDMGGKGGAVKKFTVSNLHKNKGIGNLWLHDFCAVAVYFCKDCLETTALYNQG